MMKIGDPMKICYICSRYADPDINNRRRNLAEARALALWAEAQGYAVVTWWGSLSQVDPLFDGDPEIRRAVLARSAELAEMVGKLSGDLVIPKWYDITAGMEHDQWAYLRGGISGPACGGIWRVDWSDVEPYYTAPVETVPRAKVQAERRAAKMRGEI